MRTLFLGMLLLAPSVAGQDVAAQGVAVAPQAQVNAIDKRVGTLEGQMRAVQRQVFPGGDKRFFAPEVTPEAAPAVVQPGSPATSPLADLTQRVDGLERQQRSLTGQVEQLQFQIRQLQSELTKVKGDTEFRLNAIEGSSTAATPASIPPTSSQPPQLSPPPAKPAAREPAPAQAQTESPAPATGDPLEAAYRAGYARYAAGDYAGAEKALAAFVADNPQHSRAGYAQFWAGRAMMQQGKHAPAAKAFLAGYQSYPRGDRAPNSLLWLGRALLAMQQPKAACQALDQLRTAFPDKLVGQLGADASTTRAQAKCGA